MFTCFSGFLTPNVDTFFNQPNQHVKMFSSEEWNGNFPFSSLKYGEKMGSDEIGFNNFLQVFYSRKSMCCDRINCSQIDAKFGRPMFL